MQKKWLYIAGSAVAILLLLPAASFATSGNMTTELSMSDILNAAAPYIGNFEGFSSTPYWDVSRYSWGYGTQAPGPTGTITQAQALQDMTEVVTDNYNYLSPLITRPLNTNQWSALLSFAYNEGPGNADNLVSDINAGDDSVLQAHWKRYIYAGGVVNSTLVNRRNAEWQTWVS